VSTAALYGGVEAGGTKIVCMVGRGPADVLAEAHFPTALPGVTLPQIVAFFRPFCEAQRIQAIGIGTFGPCDLDLSSPTYGYITSTPKPGWQNTDMVGTLVSALHVKVAFDTDVNAAGFGEFVWGAAVGTATSLYLTVGTGIGGGYVVDGRPLHGLQHPEMGHIRVQHDRNVDPFAGACPYHGDCLEGLISGPAIEQRFGRRGEELDDSDPFWDLAAGYLGAAIASYILVLSPSRIVIGGGIMQRSFLLPRIQVRVQRQLADYICNPALTQGISRYLVPPQLGPRSGVLGALALAASLSGEDPSSFQR
jgi:fructokinase